MYKETNVMQGHSSKGGYFFQLSELLNQIFLEIIKKIKLNHCFWAESEIITTKQVSYYTSMEIFSSVYRRIPHPRFLELTLIQNTNYLGFR
jgi:hypothetical protein